MRIRSAYSVATPSATDPLLVSDATAANTVAYMRSGSLDRAVGSFETPLVCYVSNGTDADQAGDTKIRLVLAYGG